MVDAIADDVLDQGDDLLETNYQFHEFLETQGTRLHFLTLLIQQLEQSAESIEEANCPAPGPRAQAPQAEEAQGEEARGQGRRREGLRRGLTGHALLALESL